MTTMTFENEKFSYDSLEKKIFVDNFDKKTRAVFQVENGAIVQKTKTSCSAEGLQLFYKNILTLLL